MRCTGLLGVKLKEVKKTHFVLKYFMKRHYSSPKGFVGRSICFLVFDKGTVVGAIVGGTSTLHLPGRDEFFGISKSENRVKRLNSIINNVFYHVNKELFIGKPPRNYFKKILTMFEDVIARRWEEKYGDKVVGFESLVELPRAGEGYIRSGYERVGTTKGFTCKRESSDSGKGNRDSWSGVRVWNTDPEQLRPKGVFCKRWTAWGNEIT